MRVLHINCNFINRPLHKVMYDHFSSDHDIRVFCPVLEGITIPSLGQSVKAINCFNKADRFMFFRKSKKLLSALEKSFVPSEFDCFHAFTLFTDGNVALNLHKKYAKPFIVAVRATDFLFFKYRLFLRKKGIEILRSASRIVFLSDVSKEYLIKHYVPEKLRESIAEKCVIIPNGLDDYWLDHSRQRDASLKNNDQIRLLCVSELIKRKNIPLVIQAVNALNKSGKEASLTVIGRIKDRGIYRYIVRSPNVSFFEPMQKERLIEHYRSADLFVLPSVSETFGLVYAEAISQGLPVLYTKGEGFDGQFKDGVVGYSVYPTVDGILHGIDKALKNYDQLTKKCTVEAKKFDWSKIDECYVAIYQNIIQS